MKKVRPHRHHATRDEKHSIRLVSPDPPDDRSERPQRLPIILVSLTAFLVRAAFAAIFPTIHGGDAAARLAHPNELVLGYQLPLPQLFVAIGKSILDNPIGVRLLFCMWGGVLAGGFTALVGRVFGIRAGVFAGFLVAFDPFLVHYSIVPYQESVAYGLLAWAFVLARGGWPMLGALAMGAACLSRYETWLFLPAFLLVARSWGAAVVASLPIFGWLMWWRGLAPGGLYVLDLDPSAGRISRAVFLGRKFLEYETAFVGALALIGALLLLFPRPNPRALKGAGTVLCVVGVTVVFGHEYPPGSGLMSERMIHLPVLLALGLVAIALDRLSGTSRIAAFLCVALALGLGARNLLFETRLLRSAAADPDLALARETARSIEAVRGPAECVSVSAPAVDPRLLQDYVDKVEAAFGDVARARERARALSGASPDLDRIAAHLGAPGGTVRREAGCPLVVLVDGEGATDATFALVAEISAGPRRARLYRTRR